MASTIPAAIECQILHQGNPVQGLMVQVQLKTIRKNPYTVVFGPTDMNGRAMLLRDELVRWAAGELSLAIMDFEQITSVFSGIVVLSVMDRQQLARALGAYDMFKTVMDYPKNYQADLIQAKEVLDSLGAEPRFEVHASATPTSIRIMVTGGRSGQLSS